MSEFCERCGGGPLPPWAAPDDQWNAVTEHPHSEVPNGRGAILCPKCFVNRAADLYGEGIVAKVELHQKRCSSHGYWPPCPDFASWDPCRWEPVRVEFGARFQAALMAQQESRST